mmetsp:Transcript_60941/g.122181  ORF Transcript_60941/g.122181 Transcript_60941/m.122181 type:complete len:132 (+) Transcript_60941:116-511(+)
MRGTIHDPIDGQSREAIAQKQWAPIAEFERRRQQELEERRAQRQAEGGRGGGFNERQKVEAKERAPADEDGYDDFGRRVTGRSGGKADKAKAALERLRQRASATGGQDEGQASHRRSRSRSRQPDTAGRRR